MDLNTFQLCALGTATYPRIGGNLTYPILGLVSEAGEVAGAAKRIDRDDNGVLTRVRRNEIAAELGDALWYLSQVAYELEIPLEDIATSVLAKLSDRAARGVIQGKGDRR